MQFYATHFPARFGEAEAKIPFSLPTDTLTEFKGEDYKKEFTQLKHLLANMGVNVPTLYKQYTEVCEHDGVAFLDFNIDPDFCDCVDGLVVVDTDKLLPKKRKRYIQCHQLERTA